MIHTKFKFLTFIDPALSYIDSGKLFRKPFSWLYVGLAVLNAILPFYLFYKVVDSGAFQYAGTKFVFAFIFAWLFVVAAGWVGMQIWWNRKDRVLETSPEGADLPVTPAIAHLIQTFGEWLGAFVAIVGFGISFCGVIFLGSEAGDLSRMFDLPFNIAGIGLIGLIVCPAQGFLIIVLFKFISELIRVMASIANNTKK